MRAPICWTGLLDGLARPPGFGMGHVVDFIDCNGWFVGNLADIALTLGLVLFGALARVHGRPRKAVSRVDLVVAWRCGLDGGTLAM